VLDVSVSDGGLVLRAALLLSPSPARVTAQEDAQLKEYTWEEIQNHQPNGTQSDTVWFVLHGRVYDVTEFLPNHPGGDEILRESGGQDATNEFENRSHSAKARNLTKKYLIGKVKGAELSDIFEQTDDDVKKWNINPEPESKTSSGYLNLVLVGVGVAAVALLATRYFRKN